MYFFVVALLSRKPFLDKVSISTTTLLSEMPIVFSTSIFLMSVHVRGDSATNFMMSRYFFVPCLYPRKFLNS